MRYFLRSLHFFKQKSSQFRINISLLEKNEFNRYDICIFYVISNHISIFDITIINKLKCLDMYY